MIESTKQLPKSVHLVGIGGAGMLPLGLCLKQAGVMVSGEDDNLSEAAQAMLVANEIPLFGASELLERGTEATIVRSSAVSEMHPAIRLARENGWVSMKRGECLALLASRKRLIGIAGSHGKTSTCGMLIDLFEQSGQEPSYLLGGLFANGKPPGRWNESEWLIAELDESDGTIEGFAPEIAVILNADHDHHSQYEDAAAYKAAFERLAKRARGAVALPSELRNSIGRKLENIEVVYPKSEDVEGWHSNLQGAFNRENMSYARAALIQAGINPVDADYKEFTLIRRRQGCLYLSPAVTVLEDYAHHPVEIEAYAKSILSESRGRSIAVFQPHRYSRTRSLKDALAEQLAAFDAVYLLDVYPASERPIDGGSSVDLLEACKRRFNHCFLVPSDETLDEALRTECAKEGEITIVFLGAGKTDVLGRRFSERLASRNQRWGSLFLRIAPFSSHQTRIRSMESLANKTTLRVGGPAEMYLEPSSLEELRAAVIACNANDLPVPPLGRGSNLIVADKGVAGLVIRLSHPVFKRYQRIGEGEIRVGAGLRIKELCSIACREGLEGFEFLEGIPGSVGGALRMNAGAMGGWMFDVVESVRYLSLEGDWIDAKASDLEVGYRHCRELERAIAIDAILKSTGVNQEEAALRKRIDVYQSKRKESQPREPSAGCIFKNPEGDSAGRLIDELGLKGTAIGGAEISETHGNFIINRGGASSEDVLELVKLARRVAKERRGLELEPEALLYGDDWKEALS